MLVNLVIVNPVMQDGGGGGGKILTKDQVLAISGNFWS